MPRNPAEDALLRLTLAGDDLFKDQVLARLEPTDRGMLRLTSKALRLTMDIDEQLDRKLEVSRFIGSEKSFDWALKNNLGLVGRLPDICRYAARNGHLELLKMIKHKADIPSDASLRHSPGLLHLAIGVRDYTPGRPPVGIPFNDTCQGS